MKRIGRATSTTGMLIIFGLLMLGGSASIASAATPTPTRTPGPQNNPANSFYVDPNAQLPWPVPSTPILPTAVTPQPTVYAATPPHATDYANTLGTATAQIGGITAPINGVTTPLSSMLTNGPQASGDDIEVTGIDGDPVMVGDYLSDMADGLGDTFAAIRAIPEDLADISPTFLVLVFLLAVMLFAPLFRSAMELLATLIRAILGLVRAIREIINTIALVFK